MPVTLTGLVVGFAILFVVFRAMDWLRPRERRIPILRRGLATDIAYWLFTPIVTRFVTRVSVAIVLIPFALLIYGTLDHETIMHGFGPLSQLPLWLQAIAIMAIGDFFGYWMHRWFHGRKMWNYHAIHHSSADLDWLSSVRVHPVNDAVMRIATTIPVVALGFAPIAVVGIVPILTLMAILVHANLDWDWGPLRSVLVSPRFHRWHHTDEDAARDKNFAGLFPVWDILFGTYYMPRDKLPATFGTRTPVPDGLVGQLIFPFKSR